MSLFDRFIPKFQRIEDRFDELDRQISDSAIASDGARLGSILKERGQIARTVEMYRAWRAIQKELADATAERELTVDPEMRSYCDEILDGLSAKSTPIENDLLAEFVRDADDRIESLILEVRAGVGGDEASLWAGDLCRMYLRHCERKGYKVEILDEARSAVDGYKEVVLGINGAGAFAALKFESGGHRVQRVPTTEAQGRIHTSAATVAVLPEATEVEIDIKDGDLRIDAFRSSGPGGQNVNKVSSAIRITHVPSGLVVACQDEKSQHKNKARAMKILRARLLDHERQKVHDERSKARKSLIGSGDRSERIRTYNFPQSRITDHRINFGVHNLQEVLDGNLEELTEALVRYEREQKLNDLANSTE